MTKKDAAKLLELIQLSYPNFYKDTDDEWKRATINMWQVSFPDVPYALMESAFNHFRMVSKFPPTVAEMVEELRKMHYRATELALICKSVGEEEMVKHHKAIMQYTARFKNADEFWAGVNGSNLPRLGGEVNAHLGLPGTE